MVLLVLVVSGATILGDVREVKANWGNPYAMNASVSLYFYYGANLMAVFGSNLSTHGKQMPITPYKLDIQMLSGA